MSGGFRYVQIVFQECIDRGKSFFIQFFRNLSAKDLFDEHFTEIDRQLIDQSSDSECAVCSDRLFRIKDLADIQCHFSFLIALRNIFQFFYDRTVCHTHIDHRFCVHHCNGCFRYFYHFSIRILCLYLFDNDQCVFIYCRYIIAGLRRKHTL